MKTAGIIAEYNPFHNGHQYQINELRARTGADFIIIAMSGNFVQRGEPAVFDKYTRTRMALNAGADLVLELPAAFAVSSAEDFAACGVALFDKLNVVNLLCFGSECGTVAALEPAARLLAEEPESYRILLRKRLSLGDSFPKAREQAVTEWMKEKTDTDEAALKTLLSSPNNILGMEYMKALLRRGSSIKPYTIQRNGQGYNDSNLDAVADGQTFASASAIRTALRGADFTILGQMPGMEITDSAAWTPVFPDDFSALLNYRLLSLAASGQDLTMFSDVSRELADRIGNRILEPGSYTERIGQLKTRQYTYTRVSRALLHILLGTTTAQIQNYRDRDYAPCARILGFRKSAGPLLAELKKNSRIPLISKVADAEKILTDAQALHSFRYDLYCAHLYQSVVYQKNGLLPRNEYTQPIVII